MPSNWEWSQLTAYCSSHSEYVCGENSDNIAKALAADYGWQISTAECAVGNDLNANNATGFSALPAGTYYGSYGYFGKYTYFWSATVTGTRAYARRLHFNSASVSSSGTDKYNGLSVRCVRD